MNNNVIKLILCTGIFFSTNFGMEKKPRISYKKEQESRSQLQRDRDKADQERKYERCVTCCALVSMPVFYFLVLNSPATSDYNFSQKDFEL